MRAVGCGWTGHLRALVDHKVECLCSGIQVKELEYERSDSQDHYTFQARALASTQHGEEGAEVVVGGVSKIACLNARASLASIQRGSENQVRKFETELEGMKSKVSRLQLNVESTSTMLFPMVTTTLRHEQQLQQIREDVQEMQQCMALLAVNVDKMFLVLSEACMTKPNGVFVWKIPEVRRRHGDAVDGKSTSLCSSPFYAGANGYKMCVRAYLDGDGVGKGTHLSVFFVLMRSEHDPLLQWPFSQSVTLTLINQAQLSHSITNTFQHDPRSPSFQRPKSDMNTASGCPKFAPQSLLQDESFVKDDVMFFKCTVDLSGVV
jgi:TNF receptor-associated factor 2/TNF receptor-associated factor 3